MTKLAATLLISLATASADLRTIDLWPKGAPGEARELGPEKDMTKETDNLIAGRRLIRLGNVSKPTITVYPAPADKAHGGAVLVAPGGGYHILAMDLEGTEVCERLNEMGFTAVLLKYRVPRPSRDQKPIGPLQDAQRAIGLMRQHAAEWKIDPKRIGVLGFSAGGHLAAAVSNATERKYEQVDEADTLESRPNFTVLIYPGYLADDKDTDKVAPDLNISTNTPQAFLAMSADDPVKVENALVYASALRKAKVPFELHIYPTGGHGYGLRKTEEPVTTWPDRLEDWFAARGLNRR